MKFKRLTKPRQLILNFLKNNQKHFRVQELFLHIKKQYPKIGYGTIYRNLNILKKQRIIQEIKDKYGSYFEYNLSNHAHFKCIQCDKLYDISLNTKKIKKSLENQGYKLKNSNIIFEGLCNKCNIFKNKI